jgi:hypothetical protein
MLLWILYAGIAMTGVGAAVLIVMRISDYRRDKRSVSAFRACWREAHLELLRAHDGPGMPAVGAIAVLAADKFNASLQGRPGRHRAELRRFTPNRALEPAGPMLPVPVRLEESSRARVEQRALTAS